MIQVAMLMAGLGRQLPSSKFASYIVIVDLRIIKIV